MKIYKHLLKRSIALLVLVTLICGLLPLGAIASESGDDYSIANDYIKYTINSKTGGFCIETIEGHPQKSFDNKIPLLYKDDMSRSNGTSFTTVRIDQKDYIFGQQYGFFGIDTKLSMPVVSEEGRQISVVWSIKGYDITQKVAISMDQNNNLAGNVGVSYSVKNNNGTAGNVGIRLMLDNALDSNIDAPYVVADNNISPSIVETEFSKEKGNLPQQLRFIDSLSTPAKMGYAILAGWSGEENILPDKVIVGHWANLANTRYKYEADTGCDFSNYSNAHKTPDTASAFYWSEQSLSPSSERKMELIYGIGNFSKELRNERLGINMTVGSVNLDSTGNAYEDGGKFPVTVTLDNSVDGARNLIAPIVTLTVEDGLVFESTGTKEYNVTYTNGIAQGNVKEILVNVIADKQAQITSKRIVAAVSGAEYVDEATQQIVEYSSNRNVLLPACGGILPDIQMTQISPDTVYFEGEKNITISGKMAEFRALAGSVGWDLYLTNSKNEKVLIDKSTIAFIDDNYETMSFSTDKELTIGTYKIMFEFTDVQLVRSFGSQVTSAAELNVSSDPRDRCISYGIVAMIRFTDRTTNRVLYDLFSFKNEDELDSFKDGGVTKSGIIHKNITMDEGKDEILMTVRGKIRQMVDDNGKLFFQTNKADGDVTINNMLAYCGDKPLELTATEDGVSINGDGTIKVINSINVWHNEWSFSAENGKKYTLKQDEVGDTTSALEMSLDGAGSILQQIAGFLIDIKYGVLTESDGLYGISFGGKITLPISGKSNGDDDKKDGDGDDEENGGELSAEINSILYGQKSSDKIGFVGIDTTVKVGLPENVLGKLVKNVGGIEAEVTINTIENYYKVKLGVELKVIKCEGTIALKQVPVKTIPRVLPDELSFKLSGEAVEVPIVPPFVSLSGVGGGIKDLADSFSDDKVGELPPVTLMLSCSLVLIETLDGDFDMELALTGFSLEGEFKLRGDDDGKILKMKAGLNARWISPFSIKAYGSISVIDGLLKGGFTIKISDNYFYGYIYASLNVPDSVPLVGGMELGRVEAAVSSDFIGANVKIIGIKFGFIYYWEGDFSFGKGNYDLSSRGGAVTALPESYYNEKGELVSYTSLYGTNLRRLTATKLANARAGDGSITKDFDPTTEDALLLEVPLKGAGVPNKDEIKLTNPNNEQITMIPDDGNGNGNYLIQNRGAAGTFLYITITAPSLLKKGQWKLSVTTPGVIINDFNVDAVGNLPVINGVSFTHSDDKSKELNVSWTTDCESSASGTIDIYVTKDANVMSKLQSSNISEDVDLPALTQIPLDTTKSGSKLVTIPDSFEEGTYYVVAMLSQKEGGMSKVISSNSFNFVNDALPKKPEAINVSYGGNNGIKIDVSDPVDATYQTYLVTLLDKDGVQIPGGYGEFTSGAPIYFNLNKPKTNIPMLTSGETYTAQVATRRTVDGVNYYSTGSTLSSAYVMPQVSIPKLVKVESNVDPNVVNTNNSQFRATYTFDQSVKFVSTLDGKKGNIVDEFKNVWTVDMPLEDGDHIISFNAVNEMGDNVKGDDFTAVNGSIFGLTVDTEPPVLTIGVATVDALDKDTAVTTVSNQTVFMDKDGKVTLEGLTEKGSVLTLDGSESGILVSADGSFKIERTVDNAKANVRQILNAVDKAGNETELTINIVNRELAAFDAIKLLADATVDIDSETGIKYIELSVGESVSLSAYGNKNELSTALTADQISWNVLYEQNIITISNGRVTAIAPGETAIRAAYKTASYDGMAGFDGDIDGSISDVIVVKITDPGYRYKLTQTSKYTIFTLIASKDLGCIIVNIGENPTVLLYDEKEKAYIGAFNGVVSSDEIIKNMDINEDSGAVPLISGDADNDGSVTAIDIKEAISIYLIGYIKDGGDANKFIRTDFNNDGKIDIVDAQLMLMKLLKEGK